MKKSKRLRVQNSELGDNKIIIDGEEFVTCPKCGSKHLAIEIYTKRRIPWESSWGVHSDKDISRNVQLICDDYECKEILAEFTEHIL